MHWLNYGKEKPEEFSATPLLYVVTRNYDAMKQFFTDLGVRVDDSDEVLQFVPGFNQGRGTAIYLSDMTVCLEEATDTEPSGALYFFIDEISEERLRRLSSKYPVKIEKDMSFTPSALITPPDGGCLIAALPHLREG
ncbi:MAG: hypothetical protein CMO55_12480 [Verrucomicrobiales bacterium]|nr:hypothetical protein [Verrucomicrobiales bacterium]